MIKHSKFEEKIRVLQHSTISNFTPCASIVPMRLSWSTAARSPLSPFALEKGQYDNARIPKTVWGHKGVTVVHISSLYALGNERLKFGGRISRNFTKFGAPWRRWQIMTIHHYVTGWVKRTHPRGRFRVRKALTYETKGGFPIAKGLVIDVWSPNFVHSLSPSIPWM